MTTADNNSPTPPSGTPANNPTHKPTLDPVQLRAIDAIVNGMLDAQAAGELHLLEQLRSLSLHAGPAFDDAVQARLSLQQHILDGLAVQASPDVSSKVLARLRTERASASVDPIVAENARASARAATLARVHERNERVRESQLLQTGSASGAASGTASDASRGLSYTDIRSFKADGSSPQESQGGSPSRSVHHRRRLVSSTALAFFAGGVVTLAIVAVQLMRAGAPLPHAHQHEHMHASQAPAGARPMPLTLEELTSKAYFEPDALPLIEEDDDDDERSNVLRLGNAWQFDRVLPEVASSAGTISPREVHAHASLPAPAQPNPRMKPDATVAAGAQPLFAPQLTPLQHAQAVKLLHWGFAPWQLPQETAPALPSVAPLEQPLAMPPNR